MFSSADWLPTAWLTLLLAATLPLAFMPLLRRRRTRLGAGTHVLITGGSRGLGLELAKECARRGCNVTIVARDQQGLDTALEQLRAATAGSGDASDGGRPHLQALSADTGDLAQACVVLRAGHLGWLVCLHAWCAHG